MVISEIEQETQDIDWFFTNGKHVCVAASAGGKLPRSVSASAADTALLASFFNALPRIGESVTSSGLNVTLADDKQYLDAFRGFAEKGIFSFDKTVPGTFSDTRYHLVMVPTVKLKTTDLPDNILVILNRTVLPGTIKSNFKLD